MKSNSKTVTVVILGGIIVGFLLSFVDFSERSVEMNCLILLSSLLPLIGVGIVIYDEYIAERDTPKYNSYYKDRLPSSCRDMIIREEQALELEEDYLDYLADKEPHDSCEDERITEELENYR
mgnify:CR=1 FL=1